MKAKYRIPWIISISGVLLITLSVALSVGIPAALGLLGVCIIISGMILWDQISVADAAERKKEPW